MSLRAKLSTKKQEKQALVNPLIRSRTFREGTSLWSVSLPEPEEMAFAGFYFTPTEKNTDCVTCYSCGIKMFNWLPGDDPKIQHRKFNQNCKEVKTWKLSPIDPNEKSTDRAPQTDFSFGKLFSNKVRGIKDGLHRDETTKISSSTSSSFTPIKSSSSSDRTSSMSVDPLEDVRRRRQVAQKSLEGLEKLVGFYGYNNEARQKADESIIEQKRIIEDLRQEESRLEIERGIPAASATSFSSSPSLTGRSGRTLPTLPNDSIRISPSSSFKVPSRSGSSVQSSESTATNQVFWYRYKTEGGIPYYYNTMTQETVWTLPDQTSTSDILSPSQPRSVSAS